MDFLKNRQLYFSTTFTKSEPPHTPNEGKNATTHFPLAYLTYLIKFAKMTTPFLLPNTIRNLRKHPNSTGFD